MRRGIGTVVLELVLVAAAAVFAFPLYLLVVMSLKSPEEIARTPFSPPGAPRLANYTQAWTEASLGRALLNTVVVTAVSVSLLVLLGSLASYLLARRLSGLSNAVYLLFLGGSGQETLPVAIYAFVGQYVSRWNLIFAGLVIAMLPVLVVYFLLQRHMIKGFASGVRG